jgi:hypothetical protein
MHVYVCGTIASNKFKVDTSLELVLHQVCHHVLQFPPVIVSRSTSLNIVWPPHSNVTSLEEK